MARARADLVARGLSPELEQLYSVAAMPRLARLPLEKNGKGGKVDAWSSQETCHLVPGSPCWV